MWVGLILLLISAIIFISYISLNRANTLSKSNSVGSDFESTNIDIPGFVNANGSVGQLTVNGNQLNNGNLTVTGTTNLTGQLNVGGDANFAGILTATSLQGDGSGVYNLQASNISGIINTGNLDPNIAYLNKSFQAFVGANQLFRNSANSVAAFEVQNAASASLLSVNTINGNVGIGTSAPNWNLEVIGQTRLVGHIFVGNEANSEFNSILNVGNLFNNDIQRVLTVQEEVTNNSVNGRIYAGLANELLVNPQYDPGFNGYNNTFAGSYSAIGVAPNNPYDYGLVGGVLNSIAHGGSGNMYLGVGSYNSLTNQGDGNIVFGVGSTSTPSITGSGSIITYAGFNATDPESPIFNLVGKSNLMTGTGNILQQVGVLIDPQRSGVGPFSPGVNANYNLASVGLTQRNVMEGQLQIGYCSGIVSSIIFYNCGNSSPITIPPNTPGNPDPIVIPANPVPGGNKLTVNKPIVNDTNASVQITAVNTTDKPLVVQGVASQSADLTQWQNSSGTALSSMDKDGHLKVATPYAGTNTRLSVNTNTAFGWQTLDNNTAVQINSDSGTLKGLVVQGAAFGTGNLQEWQAPGGGAMSIVSSNGSMGIGTSTITNKLTVTDTTSAQPARFNGSGGNQCTVDTGLGSLTCTSDENFKTNVLAIDGGLDKILQLQGVTYNWKTDANGQAVAGFVAQEVEKILPGLVKTDIDGIKSLSKESLMPYLVEAIKQQNGQVTATNQALAAQGIRIDSISEELKSLTARVDEHDKKLEEQQQQIKELQQKLKAQDPPSTSPPTSN